MRCIHHVSRGVQIVGIGALAGCNMLIGLDDVSTHGGSGGQSSTGTSGSTSSTATSGGTSSTGGTTMSTGGGETTSSTGGGGETTTSTGGGETTSTSNSTGGTGGSTTSSTSTSTTMTCTDDGDCTPPLVCRASSGTCELPMCGDGLVEGFEECDDGNIGSGDGCDAGCVVELYHQCRRHAPMTCAWQETRCEDLVDNDNDTLTDWLDPDCLLPVYAPQPACSDPRVYRSVDVPLDVPDADFAGIRSVIVVQEDIAVGHVSVVLDIVHPRDGDLEITLIPPFGQPRTLSSDNGGNGADYAETVLDNTCVGGVANAGAPFSDCYKPESFLPSSGQPARGPWALSVRDEAAGQTGTLTGWTLVVCPP